MNDQRTQPMGGKSPSQTMPNVPAADPNSGFQMPQYGGGDFGGPSQRPSEPVTAGAALGPGPGPASPQTMAQRPTGAMTQMLQSLSATDTSGVLASLYQAAQQRGV